MPSKKKTAPALEPGVGRRLKDRPERMAVSDRERLDHQRAIGRRVNSQRLSKKWSTVDLAERTGLAPQNIRQLEAGEQAPRTWTIYLIAAALECPAGWLAFGG